MIERHHPGWTLAAGMVAIGIGDLWLAAIPATDLSIAVIVAPLLIVGIGFTPTGQTVPLYPIKDVAFHALSNAYAIGYLICAICALIAALIAGVFLAGRAQQSHITDVE